MKAQVRTAINELIAEHKHVMLLFVNGRCYLLRNHWQYLDPESAQKVLVAHTPVPSNIRNLRDSNRGGGGKICYLTEKI